MAKFGPSPPPPKKTLLGNLLQRRTRVGGDDCGTDANNTRHRARAQEREREKRKREREERIRRRASKTAIPPSPRARTLRPPCLLLVFVCSSSSILISQAATHTFLFFLFFFFLLLLPLCLSLSLSLSRAFIQVGSYNNSVPPSGGRSVGDRLCRQWPRDSLLSHRRTTVLDVAAGLQEASKQGAGFGGRNHHSSLLLLHLLRLL